MDEHLKYLDEVLRCLKEYNLRAKKEKCFSLQMSVDYLDHRVDSDGIHATTEKLDAIAKPPRAKNVNELRSFLGLYLR